MREKKSMGNIVNKNNKWEGNIYIYKGGRIEGNDRDKIRHVRISESVSTIHDQAFYECTNLQTVEFSKNNENKIKDIGKIVFYRCGNLLSINLQDTHLESIGDDAFCHCDELATVQFPSSIQRIGESSFRGCRQLKAVNLSHATKMKTIEKCAFAGCTTLSTVILPPTTSRIGKCSFYSCTALEIVDLRATCVNEIDEGAFEYCSDLTTIHLPTTLELIGKDAFFCCEKLSSLDLQVTSIKQIGDRAFVNCIDLKTISFPKTLRYIGKYSFCHCNKLECMSLDKTSIEKIGNCAFFNCTNLATVVGVSANQKERQETMDDISFHCNDYMKLPASLVQIGRRAFFQCPSLKVNIDNNSFHYVCDINRGGRRFLQRHHHHHRQDSDGKVNGYVGKTYYSSLWPLILSRILHELELPQDEICPNNGNLSLYTKAGPLQRRASVVFYLMVHGITADLQPTTTG